MSGALVLTRASVRHASDWVRRGLVAAYVVPLPGWTGILSAEASSHVGEPYDEAPVALLGHAGDRRTRPLIGVSVDRGRAVLALQRRTWHPVPDYLVRVPGTGLVDAPGLRRPAPAQILAVAGTHGTTTSQLRHLLVERSMSSSDWVASVFDVLGLPGADLLLSSDPGAHVTPTLPDDAHLVEPAVWAVERFTELVSEDERRTTPTPRPRQES